MISQATIDKIKKNRKQPEYYKVIQDLKSKYNIIIFHGELSELGKGSFGTCYLGKVSKKQDEKLEDHDFDDLMKNDEIIAIKVISKSNKNSNSELYSNQINNISRVESQNVVKVYPYQLESDRNYYIVMEYCNNCSLFDLIENRKMKKKFTLWEFIQIMLDLVNGYLGLKVKGMLHNDLKPQNIFIKNKFFKIGDFGLSVKLSHCNEEVQCGTIVYAAPEKLNPLAENTDIDHKSDIFSIGLILFQILYGHHPYYEKTSYEIFRQKFSEKMKNEYRKFTQKQFKRLTFLKYLQENSKLQMKAQLQLEPFDKQYDYLMTELQKLVFQMCALSKTSRKSLDQLTQRISELGLEKKIKRLDLFPDLQQLSRSQFKFQLANMSRYAVSIVQSNSIRTSFSLAETQPITIKSVNTMKTRLEITLQLIKIFKKLKEILNSYHTDQKQAVNFNELITNYIYYINLRELKLTFSQRNSLSQSELRVANRQDLTSLINKFLQNDSLLFNLVHIELENYSSGSHGQNLANFIFENRSHTFVGSENWSETIAWILLYNLIKLEQSYQNNQSGMLKQLLSIEQKIQLLTLKHLSNDHIKQGHQFIRDNQEHFDFCYNIQS